MLISAFHRKTLLALTGASLALTAVGSGAYWLLAPSSIIAPSAKADAAATTSSRFAAVPIQTTPAKPHVDPNLPVGTQPIPITVGFECSLPDIKITTPTPAHYVVQSTQQVATGGFYLLLRVEGVAGKTVQIDLKGAPFDHWGNAFPQVGYIEDLNHLAGFASTTQPTTKPWRIYKAQARTVNKPALPDTNGQQWHYVSSVWRENGSLCLKLKFEKDAYLALRQCK